MKVEDIDGLAATARLRGDFVALEQLRQWSVQAHAMLTQTLKRTRSVQTDYVKQLKELIK